MESHGTDLSLGGGTETMPSFAMLLSFLVQTARDRNSVFVHVQH